MSNAKAPPILTYAAFSLIVILASIYCKHIVTEHNALTWIGQNSLMFYFAQGISSSILYYMIPFFERWDWPIRFIVCAVINVAMAFGIVAILKLYYFVFDQIIGKIGLRRGKG